MEILKRSLSDLATTIPGASTVFRELDLNFCADGQQSLAAALADRKVDSSAVVKQLEALHQGDAAIDWSKASPTRLISHILERYHACHREQLPELVFLATKVERVHQAKPECPKGLAEMLRDINHELDSHMMKEEQILFPMLGGGVYPNGPINVMQDEHDDHLESIKNIMKLTNNMTPPECACNSWKALYLGLQTFCDDLIQHVELENQFLFIPPQTQQ